MTSLRRPLIRYFGSKWNSCKHYPPPSYDILIEPFAGSATYASHYPEKQVVLVDLDPDLVALWQWLIAADPAEVLSLPVAELQQGLDLRTLPIRPEAAMLIARWQRVGRNNCMTVSKWNNMSGLWQESVKQAIVEALPKIRHWKVVCADYRDLPNIEATWFIDPPYQHVKGYKFESIDYRHLAQWCHARFGQVIVCEQEGADWLPFRSSHEVASGRTKQGGTKHKSKEVIWVNL